MFSKWSRDCWKLFADALYRLAEVNAGSYLLTSVDSCHITVRRKFNFFIYLSENLEKPSQGHWHFRASQYQGRHLYIFKVFIEYRLNLASGCISMFSVNLTFDKTLMMQFCYFCLQIATFWARTKFYIRSFTHS